MAATGVRQAGFAVLSAAGLLMGGCVLGDIDGPSQASLDQAAQGLRADLMRDAPAAAKRRPVVYCQPGTFMDAPMQCGISARCFGPEAARQLDRFGEAHRVVEVGSYDLPLVVDSGRRQKRCR